MVTPTCLSMLPLKFTALALVSHSSALDRPSSVNFTFWNQRVQLFRLAPDLLRPTGSLSFLASSFIQEFQKLKMRFWWKTTVTLDSFVR